MIQIHTDISGALAGVEELLGRDLPFTIARFLTMQAKGGQGVAIEKEKGLFKLRNDWTTRNTKITPATKSTLLSEVYTDTGNRKSDAPDYLTRQDEGGEKVPFGNRNHLAIPTRYLRKIVPGIIPPALRPSSLLPPDAKVNVKYTGRFGAVGKTAAAYPRTKRQTDVLGAKDFVAFLQFTATRQLCIFVRHGGSSHNAGRDAEPWYTLVNEARVKAVFPMEQIVGTEVARTSEENFDRALLEVLTNRDLGWARVTL